MFYKFKTLSEQETTVPCYSELIGLSSISAINYNDISSFSCLYHALILDVYTYISIDTQRRERERETTTLIRITIQLFKFILVNGLWSRE